MEGMVGGGVGDGGGSAGCFCWLGGCLCLFPLWCWCNKVRCCYYVAFALLCVWKNNEDARTHAPVHAVGLLVHEDGALLDEELEGGEVGEHGHHHLEARQEAGRQWWSGVSGVEVSSKEGRQWWRGVEGGGENMAIITCKKARKAGRQ